MWDELDPIEVKDKTLAMNVAAKACLRLATTLRLAPVSKIAVKKQDTFIRKYAAYLLDLPHGEEQTRKTIELLELANICQCNVVIMSHDKGEWDYLYKITREMLEEFLYPHYPEAEDEGMELYYQMTHA